MRKSRSLTGIEAPDHEQVEAVQAPAHRAVWFERNIFGPAAVLHLRASLLSQDNSPLHQGKPPQANAAARRTCQPNDIIRRSFLGPRHSHSSHPLGCASK